MRKPFRSLRIRLQFWHALILLMVVGGFGSVLYRSIIESRWDEVDAQLLATGRVLEGGLRSVPRPVLDSMAQDINTPRPTQPRRRPDGTPLRPPMAPRATPPMAGPPAASPDRAGPNPLHVPSGIIPPGTSTIQWDDSSTRDESQILDEWERTINLPATLPIDNRGRDIPAYYVIWRRDGSILRQKNVPYGEPTRPKLSELTIERRSAGTPELGPLREIFLRGPENTLICVGRGVRGEVGRMWRLAWQLSLAGICIMAGGLCGGWWLSRRAIAPIEQMTQTAAAISPNNLSQRMDLTGVDIELTQLGERLNSMLARLEQAFQSQQRFTSDASHELRTPLSVLLSTIELTLSRPREPEEYRAQLLKCQRAAVRMQDLIESLLALARADEGAPVDRTARVDLADLVNRCVDEYQLLAAENQVAIGAELQAVTVPGNAAELEQVVTNLIMNAIVYNRPGGSVTVKLESIPGPTVTARLSVCDTGIGIPEKDLPNLFKRFYRVDVARSRSLGGNGLGLSICQSIVSHHGGTITVSSQLDHGSQFIVTLPA